MACHRKRFVKDARFAHNSNAGLCFYENGGSVVLTGKVEIVTNKEFYQIVSVPQIKPINRLYTSQILKQNRHAGLADDILRMILLQIFGLFARSEYFKAIVGIEHHY